MLESEDNYGTELISVLNSQLPMPYRAYNSHNISIIEEESSNKKRRREFDIIILDENFVSDYHVNNQRIEFVIETKKLKSKEIGEKQAEDAFRLFPSLYAIFATNFETIYYRKKDMTPKIVSLNNKKEYEEITKIVVEIVKELIEQKNKKNIVAKDEKEIISILKQCMDIIQKEIVELPDESRELLTKRTLIMWQKSNEDTQPNLEYNIKRAASYIIVDQLLFYSLLLKKKKYLLPPLKPLDIETDFLSLFYEKYMQKAISITGDYKPIFDINLFDILPNSKKVKIV